MKSKCCKQNLIKRFCCQCCKKKQDINKVLHYDRKIQRISKGDLNPSRNPERRKQISEERTGRPLTEIQKKRIGRSLKKTLKDPKMREKMRLRAVGNIVSDETKRKMSEGRKRNRTKPLKRSTALKNADTVYSKFIRKKYLIGDYIRCFTCSKMKPFDEMDCGHFVSRSHMSTRFFEKNTHPQCRWCNRFQEGMKDEYALALMKKYGQKIIEELNEKKNEIKQFSVGDLVELTVYYQSKLDDLP